MCDPDQREWSSSRCCELDVLDAEPHDELHDEDPSTMGQAVPSGSSLESVRAGVS